MVFNPYESYISNIVVKILIAIAILLIGIVFGRFFEKLIKRILHELEINRILKEQTKFKIPLEELLSSIVKYIIYFIALILALNQLGLTATVLYIILIIILIILIIFVVLAVKDFIPNIVSGFFINQRRSIKVGDKIKVKDIEGKVIEVNLVETKIKTKKGDTIYIPNSLLTKTEMIKKK